MHRGVLENCFCIRISEQEALFIDAFQIFVETIKIETIVCLSIYNRVFELYVCRKIFIFGLKSIEGALLGMRKIANVFCLAMIS